ncbi:hypothetical protein R6242_06530 [Iodobacter sp. CM08]|uniref:hypothetical protein n=1 Tax=Iodobacter sp. CM08 TaxID=3085902 RepID=UPI002981945E|nr:hypothetical protein [Iodobacter sp. CM08]MDW5416228.1 hypothetical protein [Iodobacter sp. CM08]
MKVIISKPLDSPLAFCDTRLGREEFSHEPENDEQLELRLHKVANIAAARLEEWRWRCRERC